MSGGRPTINRCNKSLFHMQLDAFVMRFYTLDALRYIKMHLNVCIFIRKRISVDAA